MSEFKFRVWDTVMSVWVSMKLNIISETVFIKPETRHGIFRIDTFDSKAKRFIIVQFAGEKDKNGKEIYKGDILKDDVGELHEVKFGELPLDKSGDCVCTYQAFYCKCYGKLGMAPMYECTEIGNWMEIIGNIYENSELLKGK